MNRFRSLAPLAPLALLLAVPATAAAQKPGTATPAAAQNPPTVTLDLNKAPLRDALQSLFANGRLQYTLADDLPNALVTAKVVDLPFDDALRLLLQQASYDTNRRLTYTREAGVYRVRTMAMSAAPLVWERISLTYARPADIVPRMQAAFPDATVLASNPTADLLVRAPAGSVQAMHEMARLLDVAPRSLLLRAEVVMVTAPGAGSAKEAQGRSVLLASVLRTGSGQEAMGEDRVAGTPAESAKLQITATPTLLGDGTFELNTKWDVSLPLEVAKPAGAGGKAGGTRLVRLEKRLSNVSRLRAGETVAVGGVILSQYGLKGEILFFVTLTDATPVPKAP